MLTIPRHEITQLARSPLILLDYAERQGLDRSELMKLASLTPEDLADPDARIALASMLALWRAVIERHNDVALGVNVASTVKASQMGLLGYAMYYSRDLRDALLCLSRYGRILSEAVRFTVTESSASATLVFDAHPSMVTLRHPIEASVSTALRIAREITESEIVPLAVEFPSPQPDSLQPYLAAFGTAPRFDSAVAALTFTNEQMNVPATASEPALSGYLDDLAEMTLRSMGTASQGFVDLVRRSLWSILPYGKPDLSRTASTMGISARTLQRRLRAEGTAFSTVLEQLRRDLADELLANPNLAVADLAFLLGYSEPSAFQRAFRRWHGTTPREFQRAPASQE